MTSAGSKPVVAKDPAGNNIRYQTDGEPLGEGSGGVVYLARRLPEDERAAADDARRVAIKISNASKWKAYLADEARLLAGLEEHIDEITALGGGGIYRPVRILSGPKPLKVDDSYESELIELEYLGLHQARCYSVSLREET